MVSLLLTDMYNTDTWSRATQAPKFITTTPKPGVGMRRFVSNTTLQLFQENLTNFESVWVTVPSKNTEIRVRSHS